MITDANSIPRGKPLMDRLKILIADDEVSSALLIDRKVRKHLPEADTHVVRSGRECLRAMAAGTVDLLILDYVMPELDGLDVLHRLAAEPGPSRPPIIFVTGYGNEKVAAAALRAGADVYVHKTDLTDVLDAVIDKVMERQECQQGTAAANGSPAPMHLKSASDVAAENRIRYLINSHHDIRVPFQELYQEIAALMPVNCLSVGLIAPGQQCYCIHALAGELVGERSSAVSHPFSATGSCIELHSGERTRGELETTDPLHAGLGGSSPVIRTMVASESLAICAAMYQDGVRACAIFPFVSDSPRVRDDAGKVFGSLNASSTDPEFFTDARVRVLSGIAFCISLSIANQRRSLLDGLNKTVATLQHVANNALAIIVGNAELLLVTEEHRLSDRVNTIVDASMRISGCLTQLNDIRDPLLQRTTFGGVEFLDVKDYISESASASPSP